MSMTDIYKNDLTNRFPTHTFTSTTEGDLFKYEAKDGATTITSALKMSEEDAVRLVRENLVGGNDVLPMLTTTQISALSSIKEGTSIYDQTLARSGVHNGTIFK